jgi:serine/threonine protein kinase
MPSEEHTELQGNLAGTDNKKDASTNPSAAKSETLPDSAANRDRVLATPLTEGPAPRSSAFDLDREGGTILQSPSDAAGSLLRSKGPCQAPGYHILEPLGAGTYGEVWLAEEERTGIRVAIKFFAHGAGLQWQLLQAEVKQLAQLHADPGIVQLIDVEPDSNPPYYIMAYAKQGSLAKRLEKGPLPAAEALAIFRQVAEALAYVHAKGIRHCDLKPGNILLDARGRVLVADFGQAHLSCDVSPALGTFFYMAPEQADVSNQIPDTRWDVYGLGALVYAMLTGRPPREDSTLRTELAGTAELSHRLKLYRESIQKAPRLTGHRRVQGVDRALVEIIDRCLKINPEERLRDAGAVLAALDQRERKRRQRPALVFGLVAPLLLLAIMALGISLAFTKVEQQASKSQEELQKEMDKQTDERNELVADLVARDISEHLKSRTKHVDDLARDAALGELVQKRHGAKLTARLESWRSSAARPPKYAWVTSRDGKIIAIYPKPTKPVPPTSFQWREWFNGRRDLEETVQAEPIRATYVSRPFVAKSTGTMMLAITTPIRAQDGAIVGLLSMTDDFERWDKALDDGQSFMVILNARGEYLSYPVREFLQATPGQDPRRVSPDSEYMVGLRTGTSGDIREPFVDPLNGKSYVAHYAPVQDRDLRWTVFIQREHGTQSQSQSIRDLHDEMLTISLAAVIVMGILVLVLWAWLIWMLRHEEGITRA